jgi:CO/xanthine dehydrogenase Mo-binding subunit
MLDRLTRLTRPQGPKGPQGPQVPTCEPAERGLSRRGFLIASGASGLVFAFTRDAQGLDSPAAAVASARFEPTIWYQIDAQGIVTVNIIRAEMGQHVGTALARIVSDELEADWSQVRIRHVDSDPKWGLMVTGGSWSVWQSFELLSQAGAAGRQALIAAGARIMGVEAAGCRAEGGRVHAGSRSVGYGDIVARGGFSASYSAEQLKAMPIKKPPERRQIGVDTQAIDIPGKTDGRAIYGFDAKVEGMVFAAPKIPPTRNGSKVLSADDSRARGLPGYSGHLVLEDPSHTVPGWVLVFADSTWNAFRAAQAVNVSWQSDDTAGVSEDDVIAFGARQIDSGEAGALVVDDDGVDAAFKGAAQVLEATYKTASVLHFQLEPVNALALQKDGVWQVHTGNQWQSLEVPVLAKALGVDERQVVMVSYLLGGGFGRRLNGDYAVPAALGAKALGKPVKLVLTRADDARFDSIRSPSIQKLRIAFNAGGKVVAMDHAASAGWPTQVMIPIFLSKARNGAPYDPFAISGADHWYSVGAQRVRALSNTLANRAFRPGWLRSVGPGWTNWALESFIDEAAHARKIDAVAFRASLLDAAGRNAGDSPSTRGGARRQAAVVQRAAQKAGWGAKLPPDTGMGIATTFGQERDMPTWVACVARVHVDRRSGFVKLEKLTLVVDAGTVVHPDGALAQVQGGALWGASMALHEGTRLMNGAVVDTNLDTYTPLRMGDVPDMDIEFVPSTEMPVGLGEPATTVVGPAIGNAIFNAVGVRLRNLPIRAADVLAALKA